MDWFGTQTQFGSRMRDIWWTHLGKSQSTAISTVNGSTTAEKVESYVTMCNRGREKGVAIRGGGEGVVIEIVTDPRCDKRVLLHEILNDCVNKEGPAE